MKKRLETIVVSLLVLSLAFVGCNEQPKHTYTNELLLPMTPVKDQGKSELCWAYAMLATIETEHLLRGDSVNLSPQYLGRMLKRKSQRAMCQTALNLLQRYGVVGFDVMPDDATDDLPTPKNVFLWGVRYTPQQFAHSVCLPDEYIALTCFPDSPYYKKIDVPIPDNWEHNRLLNVPLDTLRQHVDQALRRRHPVCFETRGHAMAIVGIAHNENHHAYYVMKNSWGTRRSPDGLVYMPMKKAWRDAVALYMTREAYEGK